ncbi:SAM-dependent methyltransferase [Marinobacter fonticola]|uniref:SAM-dependent methyltransferase n=1 Tax=Marinobacter fonticola TaxID=2603215 RepID=UPI0011E61416|nr:SAM-dependent methyltransferase [Marinobacter fonticola]
MTSHTQAFSPDTSPEFFESLYRNSEDPWDFRSSAYERNRYSDIVGGINDRHYTNAFEPGCAIGELTALLAPYCQSLHAMDCSAAAVQSAQRRCDEFAHVDIRKGSLPGDLPGQTFDLIVFSEVGYYFTRHDLALLVARLWTRLKPGGRIIACHWLGSSRDHRLHGSVVHQTMDQVIRTPGDFDIANPGYALKRWTKPGS